MRIAFFIGGLSRGGAEKVISILANHYVEIGWDVDLVFLLRNEVGYPLHPDIRIVECVEAGGSYFRRMPRWIKLIRNYVKQSHPDRIVSFIARINVLVIAACLGMRVPIIISERNDPKHDGRGMVMQLVANLLYPMAEKIVFQTAYERDCFSKWITRKGVIIPNPISVIAKPRDSDSISIVTAGRLAPQKNHALLIDAFAMLHKTCPNYRLIIYGDGNLRDALKEQVKHLGLTGYVEMPGNVEDIHQRIANAALFVLTSEYEGQSNALLEAMMLGLPCISTQYEGVEEIIHHEVNGLLVPQHDTERLYQSMNRILTDCKLNERLRTNAIKIQETCEKSAVCKQWDNVII